MRLIEIPDDGIIRIPIRRWEDTVGEKRIDLKEVPTIDAVPVVRCGQCKFDNICCRNVGKDGKRTKDDFCSYGKRRDEDEQPE